MKINTCKAAGKSSSEIHMRIRYCGISLVVAFVILFTGCVTPPPPPFIPLRVSEIPTKVGGLFGLQGRKKLFSGKSDEEIPPIRPASDILQPGVAYVIDAYDPFEGMNRQMYLLNAMFDAYVFLPLVRGYEFITPSMLRKGISNFFDNLGELSNLTNTFLQLNFKKFAITVARLSYNTTGGLLGIFDLATRAGLKRQNEDFGQTLGYYCTGPGPYLVLPIFGPSTLRDTGGLAFDTAVYTLITNQAIDKMSTNARQKDLLKFGFTILNGIDKRHRQSFRYYEIGSPFEYELIRLLYLRKREFEIIQ